MYIENIQTARIFPHTMRIKALFLFLSIFSTSFFYSFESSAQENAPTPVIDLYLSVGMYSSALMHIMIDME